MNNEIKAFILDRLQVDAKPFAEQIDALNGQRENAYELLNAIDNIKVELSHVTMREWQKQIEQQLGISLNHDEHSFGTKLNNGVWLGVWDAHDNPDKLPYWGFEMEGYKKDSMPRLYEGIEKLIKDAGITRYRPEKAYFLAWCSTKKGVERFVSLYRSAKKAGLL